MKTLRYNGRRWLAVIRRRRTGEVAFVLGPHSTAAEAIAAVNYLIDPDPRQAIRAAGNPAS